jgi:UPF0755 protein
MLASRRGDCSTTSLPYRMSPADQNESSRPRRRRGAKRADEGFDDFWTRESQMARGGRGRRKSGTADEPDPGDVSDLTGPTPAVRSARADHRAEETARAQQASRAAAPGPRPARRGRGRAAEPAPTWRGVEVPAAEAAPAWHGAETPPADPRAAPPARAVPSDPLPARRARRAAADPFPARGAGQVPAGPVPADPRAAWPVGAVPSDPLPARRGRRVPSDPLPARRAGGVPAGPAPVPPGIDPRTGAIDLRGRGPSWGAPGPGYTADPRGAPVAPPPGRYGPAPTPRGPAVPAPGAGRAAAGGAAADWYDDAASPGWGDPQVGPDPWPQGPGAYQPPPWAQQPPARRARLESTASYRLASTLADDGYGDDAYFDDDEDVDGADAFPEDLPRRRGCRVALAVLALLVLAVGAAAFFAWSWVQHQIDPPGGQGAQVMVEVPEGTSTAGIGEVLADAGVIRNATVWSWYTKLRDVGPFDAGSYQMRRNSSFDEVVHDLSEDPLPPNSRMVTVPEGYTVSQTLARLADKEKGMPGFTAAKLQAALKAPTSRSKYLPGAQAPVEGTLFPDSYAVADDDTEAVVLQRMVGQFDQVMDSLGAADKAAKLKVSPYEALIVASLIEKEARVPEDRAKVARVIYNRLAAGTPLGVDASLCYEKGQVPCKLSDVDLKADTPYNTRVHEGLPPTPIASPGKASIAAALAPAAGDWTYYVLIDAEGHHAFTADYREFQRLKAECERKGLGCG